MVRSQPQDKIGSNSYYVMGEFMMRLFEILLLLLSAGLLVLMMFFRNSKRLPLFLTSVMGTLVLIIHLTFEGIRVQLLFPYCMVIVSLVVSVYGLLRKKGERKVSCFISVPLFSITVLSLILTAGLMYLFPVFKLPEPMGKLEVGTKTFHFIDASRKELFGETTGSPRELMVQVWYPAQNTSGRPVPFIPESAKVLKEEPMSHEIGIPRIFMDYLKYIPSHAYSNAEVSDSSPTYPLIVLNHGFGSSKIYQTSQAENLASHGYIVASIDHTYSTFATVFPDGRTTVMRTDDEQVGDKEYRDTVGKVWTDDIIFTLDQLEQINDGQISSGLKGRMNLDRIGVFGHSFGGGASYDSANDPRIKAGIDLDGALYRYDQAPVKKPFMFMFSESAFDLYNKVREHYVYTDEELEAMGGTREGFEEAVTEVGTQVGHLRYVAQHGGQILYVENTEHYNFADLQFITPLLRQFQLAGKINSVRSTTLVNAYVLDFFDKYLKDKNGTLLEGPISDYPEVKFATELFAKEDPDMNK